MTDIGVMPPTPPRRGGEPVWSTRRGRRKLILLAVLLTILALLAYSLYYFNTNRRLPIPGSLTTEQTVQPPQYVFSIIGTGSNALTRPIGLTISGDRVFVVDFGKRLIKAFDLRGRFLFSFYKINDGPEKALQNPVHLATGPGGDVYVTDRRLEGVYVFGRDGKYKRKLSPNGDPKFKWGPLAIGVDTSGTAYVTDVGSSKNHRVLYLDSAGKILHTFGQTREVVRNTDGPSQFYFPAGITPAPGGLVIVSDGDNRRVQVFDSKGEFQRFIVTQGVPRGVAIDAKNRLYVVNVLAHQVDVYDLKGKQLTTFGTQGMGPGQFSYPNDVAIDGAGRIYVTDRANNQVQVWAWPSEGLPPIPLPTKPWQWALCLLPLLLLLLPLLRRAKRLVATPDFVTAVIEAGHVKDMDTSRLRWAVPEHDHAGYAGRVIDGVDLGRMLQPEPYSASDVEALVRRLGVSEEQAIVLAMAQRTRALCTEDVELSRLAAALEVEVYDHVSFIEHFGSAQVETDTA